MIAVTSAIAVVVVAALTGAWALLRNDDSSPEPKRAITTATTKPPTSTVPPAPTAPPRAPGALAATTNGGDISVFPSPDAAAPFTTFSSGTEYGLPRTFLVINETTPGWWGVLLPAKPNGQTGWIRASDVTTTVITYRIEVDRASHTLRLFNNDQLVLESPVAVGTPSTQTPAGTFYVTDPVPGGGGSYGPWALGLSGYSEMLDSFAGGLPQIALHGTNRPDLIGQDVSNGCVRMPNDVITQIHDQVPIGTPVVIT
jgi:lipoprotein-anchoring transpeptidase ErfK/SrfK